jgi:hypothetical protein
MLLPKLVLSVRQVQTFRNSSVGFVFIQASRICYGPNVSNNTKREFSFVFLRREQLSDFEGTVRRSPGTVSSSMEAKLHVSKI